MSEHKNGLDQPAPRSGKGWIFKAATWAVTLFCFYLVYTRTEATAARESLTVAEYLLRFFSEADWMVWLMVMIPYSLFFSASTRTRLGEPYAGSMHRSFD